MQTYLPYKNIDIHYTISGTGSAVVLLHGFLENTTMWTSISEVLSKRYKVIAIDLLGHGKTGNIGYVHTMEAMAEAVAFVLQQLKIRRASFIGHSMGGYVALAFAEKNPDIVKHLCLMNSTARADSPERKVNRDRAIRAVKLQHKSFVRMAISNLFRPKNRTLFADKIKVIKKEALQTSLQGIIAALEGMKIREDREVLLHFSPYQKMMIIGKKDPILDFNSLLEQTQNSEVKTLIVPDGHMSHIENENDVIEGLLDFLKL